MKTLWKSLNTKLEPVLEYLTYEKSLQDQGINDLLDLYHPSCARRDKRFVRCIKCFSTRDLLILLKRLPPAGACVLLSAGLSTSMSIYYLGLVLVAAASSDILGVLIFSTAIAIMLSATISLLQIYWTVIKIRIVDLRTRKLRDLRKALGL